MCYSNDKQNIGDHCSGCALEYKSEGGEVHGVFRYLLDTAWSVLCGELEQRAFIFTDTVFISWAVGLVVVDKDYTSNGICILIQIPILNTFIWTFLSATHSQKQ